MIRYYTSRTLSQKLNINLAKWKRWSREFLPPDPLGGKQSGFARQYLLGDVFKVYLGGYLVGSLSLSIPDSKIILNHILEWMAENKVIIDQGNLPNGFPQEMVSGFQGIKLVVRTDSKSKSRFLIHQTMGSKRLDTNGTVSHNMIDDKARENIKCLVEEVYSETYLTRDEPTSDEDSENPFAISEKVLHISSVMMELLRQLEL